jgi:hypothetical protein
MITTEYVTDLQATDGVGNHQNNGMGRQPKQNKLQVAIRMQRAGSKMSEQATSRYGLRVVVNTAHATPHLGNRNGGEVWVGGTRVQLHYAQNTRMYSCTTSSCPRVATSTTFCVLHKLHSCCKPPTHPPLTLTYSIASHQPHKPSITGGNMRSVLTHTK